MTRRWLSSGPRLATATLTLAALWTAFIVLGAIHGFWRPLLAPRDNAQAFAEAAITIIDRDLRGNTAFALVEDGRVVAEHFASEGEPVTGDTVFQLASLSKWVAAWGVLALVEEGRIGLDTPVETYLTRWHLPPSSFDTSGVTVRRLLSHTAGLTDDLGYSGFESPDQVQTLDASLAQAADPKPGADGIVRVGAEPGASWRYSGGGYTLLQLLIEEVTGQSFPDYMRNRILRPLGMESFGYALADIDQTALAPAYDTDGTAARFRHYTALAAASLYGTTADMARFLVAHHPDPNGEPVGRGVLAPGTVAMMRTVQARSLGLPLWGLGPMLYALDGEGSFVIGHEGENPPAMTSTARLNPATGDGLVVLQTGRPELPARLGAEWVRWQTGHIEIIVLGQHLTTILLALAGGWMIILHGAVALAVRHRGARGRAAPVGATERSAI